MSRTRLFDQLRRSIRTALLARDERLSTSEALARRAEQEERAAVRAAGRREFLANAGRLAMLGAAGSMLGGASGCLAPEEELGSSARPLSASARIGVVGAGLAGLACARTLGDAGVGVDVYEAASRVGGRQWSLPGVFPGQVVERGGELIDNAHKTLLGWVNEFGLTKENYLRSPGEVFYYFGGVRYPEAVVVDQFRVLVDAMRDDLRDLGAPTAFDHTDADLELDYTNLRQYLETRGAGPVIAKAIEAAYIAEYGLEIDQQSCLGFLMFVHADRRSKWKPFGIFSDERYHVVGGNQQIAEGLRARLSGPVNLGHFLVRVARTSGGRVELTFKVGNQTRTKVHDAVVLTMPFSTLRDVELDPGLGLPDWKLRAIEELRYGTNAKMMVGFDGRPWAALGSNGAAYAMEPSCQTVWETNWTGASPSRGVLTDYSGGARGAALDPSRVQLECDRFLTDLDKVFPGARAAASRDSRGRFVAHLEHWPSNPLSKGSYTANHPGYFTGIGDLEAPPVDNLYFAGEHTSSFYEWQGFMEGAALSGLRAAGEILAAMKK